MERNALKKFIEEIRRVWGPLNSDLAEQAGGLLAELGNTPSSESWVQELLASEKGVELYRDPDHGFVLLAYTENTGLYRAPHDHGLGWVVYAVQSGQMEMGTYRLVQVDSNWSLVRRERYPMRKGDARVFLPGDIHDTRCLAGPVLMFRLTSCDLMIEREAGRMKEYAP